MKNNDRLDAAFDIHRRSAVMVIGDIMCDVYVRGWVNRISPEAPVPIFEQIEQWHVLGGAANVAANLRALGCEVRLVGVIGADPAGQRVRELLKQHGISDAWLIDDEARPTTEKTRLIAHQQHVLRLDRESRLPLSPNLLAQVWKHAQILIDAVDAVVCSDYAKGVCTASVLDPVFTIARAANLPVLVDPKVKDFSLYRGATVLTPNQAEVELASGVTVTGLESLTQAAERLLGQTQAQTLVVTRGKEGMSLFSPPAPPVHIPAVHAREVFDATGAGDTVIAAFCIGVLTGLSLAEAAHLANTAAGLVVGKMGTAVVSIEELRAALGERNWEAVDSGWLHEFIRMTA